MWKRALTMEFVGQEILVPKNFWHTTSHYSDDDALAHSNSDSNILATIEKADSVEFLDNNISTLARAEGNLDTWVTFK